MKIIVKEPIQKVFFVFVAHLKRKYNDFIRSKRLWKSAIYARRWPWQLIVSVRSRRSVRLETSDLVWPDWSNCWAWPSAPAFEIKLNRTPKTIGNQWHLWDNIGSLVMGYVVSVANAVEMPQTCSADLLHGTWNMKYLSSDTFSSYYYFERRSYQGAHSVRFHTGVCSSRVRTLTLFVEVTFCFPGNMCSVGCCDSVITTRCCMSRNSFRKLVPFLPTRHLPSVKLGKAYMACVCLLCFMVGEGEERLPLTCNDHFIIRWICNTKDRDERPPASLPHKLCIGDMGLLTVGILTCQQLRMCISNSCTLSQMPFTSLYLVTLCNILIPKANRISTQPDLQNIYAWYIEISADELWFFQPKYVDIHTGSPSGLSKLIVYALPGQWTSAWEIL